MIWLVLLVLLMCAALVACVFEGAIRAEVYPPEAADAPTNPLLDPERAKNFTEEEAAALKATAQEPAVVAADDLLWADRREMARVAFRFGQIVDASLSDVHVRADRLTAFYLVPGPSPEVER